MSGATSPRLHLELLMARLMLPASDETERGLAARIDRLERRLEYGGVPEASAQPPVADATPQAAEAGLSGVAAARAALSREAQSAEQQDQSDLQPAPQEPAESEPSAQPDPTPEPTAETPPQHTTPVQETPQPTQPQDTAPQAAAEQPAQQQAPAEPQPSQVEMVRRAWPEVLEFLKSQSRLIWMTINGNAQVVGFDGHLLTIGFDNDGARNTVQMRGGKKLLSRRVQPRARHSTRIGSDFWNLWRWFPKST